MSDQEDSVPIAGPGTDQDITFDELQHFWDEIDAIIQPCPMRLPGDFGARELLEHFNRPVEGNFKWAYERMDILVKTGGWGKMRVYDPALGRSVIVVRKCPGG